jgi:hypothetical protein
MTKALRRHDLPYHSPIRELNMKALIGHIVNVPPTWSFQLAENSLTLTSKDRQRIVKIDSQVNYTLDVRQSDGTYKSTRFCCKTVDEAWNMAFQIIKVHRSKDAIH